MECTSRPIRAPATNMAAGSITNGLIWPFLFITVACGAISGFHVLVAGGTPAFMKSYLFNSGLSVAIMLYLANLWFRKPAISRFIPDRGQYLVI